MKSPAKILAVDDEPDVEPLIRQGLRQYVDAGEYEIAFAGDGVEALDILEHDSSVVVMLTDLKMPRMDGLTLLARASDLNRPLKSVVVTAYGDIDNIRTAMNRGAFDFLMKPLRLDDLRTTIKKALNAAGQQKQAEFVRATFGRYLSDEVVRSLLERPETLELGGEQRNVSLLMSDLRGFSTIAERVSPETVVRMLNVYLGRMADIIAEHGGTILEFIGDAIFVVFGAPIPYDDHAVRAVACATAMQLGMEGVNAEMKQLGVRDLEMGIGLHAGDVIVGNIGSMRRAKYAAVGSHVNLVGRIESSTVGGQILASQDVVDIAGHVGRFGQQLTLMAKGFTDPIRLWELEGVGPPYNLSLPAEADAVVELASPVPCEITLLDGKVVSEETCAGHVVSLSSSTAVIRADCAAEQMSNLRIDMSAMAPGEKLGETYGKVVALVPERGEFSVRFTDVPGAVSSAIESILAAAAQ
ncbi:MAG: response regulator [Rhodothermia bacterium]|nr:response regulator [Rhodothermia bacterium]